MDREPPSFQLGDKVILKINKQENGISSGDLDTVLFILSITDHLHIENQATGKKRSYNIKEIVFEPPMEF